MNNQIKSAPAQPHAPTQPQPPSAAPKPPWWAVGGIALSFAVALWGFSTRSGGFSIALCVVIWLIVGGIAIGTATARSYRTWRGGQDRRPLSLGGWVRLGAAAVRERTGAAMGTGAGLVLPISAAVIGLTVLVIVKDIVIG